MRGELFATMAQVECAMKLIKFLPDVSGSTCKSFSLQLRNQHLIASQSLPCTNARCQGSCMPLQATLARLRVLMEAAVAQDPGVRLGSH
jgi:hypothetical protein